MLVGAKRKPTILRAIVAAVLAMISGIGFTSIAPAAWALGEISFDRCLADDAIDSCLDVLGTPISRASATAVSPDGKSLYVVSRGGILTDNPAIAHFIRGANGQLEFNACLANKAVGGCVDLPGEPLTSLDSVVVSPDGKSVYAAGSFLSDSAGTLAHFGRTTAGNLGLIGCASSEPRPGCTDQPLARLQGAEGVTVSPDGKSVYVASAAVNGVEHFTRNVSTGRLVYESCLANTTANGCTDVPGDPLFGASGVTVSPDNKSVYVASASSESVAHFTRNVSTGKLSFNNCFASDFSTSCTRLQHRPMAGARSVTVSPDGKSVYVGSMHSNSLATFGRNATTGALSYGGCVNVETFQVVSGCVRLPEGTFENRVNAVVVSPDNTSVYVGTGFGVFNGGGTVAHFFRNKTTGQLVLDGCLGMGQPRCTTIAKPGAFRNILGIAVSPDGKSVYAAAELSNAVTHLVRATN